MTGSLDGERESALMPGTSADLASGADFASLCQVAAKTVAILVVDMLVRVCTKRAYAANRRAVAMPSPALSITAGAAVRARRAIAGPVTHRSTGRPGRLR